MYGVVPPPHGRNDLEVIKFSPKSSMWYFLYSLGVVFIWEHCGRSVSWAKFWSIVLKMAERSNDHDEKLLTNSKVTKVYSDEEN